MNNGYESAYDQGYRVGKSGGTWFDCKFVGRLAEQWLRGFNDGRNDTAAARPALDRPQINRAQVHHMSAEEQAALHRALRRSVRVVG